MHTRGLLTQEGRWDVVVKDEFPVDHRAEKMLGVAWIARLPAVLRFFKIFLHARKDDLRRASAHDLIDDLPAPAARGEVIRFLSNSESMRVGYGEYVVDMTDLFRRALDEIAQEARILAEDGEDAATRFEEAVSVIHHASRLARKLT